MTNKPITPAQPWYTSAPPAPGPRLNQRELAEALGVDASSLWHWQRDGMPVAAVGERGKASEYDLAVVARWWLARQVAAAAPASGVRERLDRLRTRQLEIEVAKLRADHVDRAEADAAWRGMAATATRRVMQIPEAFGERWVPDIDAERVAIALEDIVRDVLEEMGRSPPPEAPVAPAATAEHSAIAGAPPLPQFDATIGRTLGVAPDLVAAWRAAGLPAAVAEADAATVRVGDVVRWLARWEIDRLYGETDRDRLARAQGDKIELEMAIAGGALVAVASLEASWTERIVAAREQLLSLPARLACVLVHVPDRTAAEDLVREAVCAALAVLGNDHPKAGDLVDRDLRAPATPDYADRASPANQEATR